jgi:hypothetical protein
MMSEREVRAVVRGVTDEEVAHYAKFGWVMMPQLVDPGFATELLRTKLQRDERSGVNSFWRQRHGRTTGYISVVILYRKCTG